MVSRVQNGSAGYLELRHGNGRARAITSEAATKPQQGRENKPTVLLARTANDSRDTANHELQARLNVALDELARNRARLSRTDAERARFAADLKQQADRLSVLEADNENSKNIAADLRAKLDQQQSRASLDEANYVTV